MSVFRPGTEVMVMPASSTRAEPYAARVRSLEAFEVKHGIWEVFLVHLECPHGKPMGAVHPERVKVKPP
jgi:hypothetical protein